MYAANMQLGHLACVSAWQGQCAARCTESAPAFAVALARIKRDIYSSLFNIGARWGHPGVRHNSWIMSQYVMTHVIQHASCYDNSDCHLHPGMGDDKGQQRNGAILTESEAKSSAV